MKQLSILLITLSIILSFNACTEDDEPTFTVSEQQSEAPVLVTANSSITLNKDIEADQAITIVWEDATYTIDTPVTYTIETAVAGSGFKEPQTTAVTSERFYTWTVSELNNLAVKIGLNAEEEAAIELRIKSSIGTNGGAEKISNFIILTLTPYSTELPRLWLPGSYAAASGYGADWDPTDPETPTLVAESFTSQVYEGYVYFAEDDSQFKITPTNTGFDGDYGDEGGSGDTGVLLQEGESNILVSKAGYYKIDVDLEALTYTLTETTSWAITGAATPNGWPNEDPAFQDHDMTYDPEAKTWSITIDLSEGEFKFRANDEWTLDYGTDGDDDGSLDFKGGNFMIDSGGNYTITLDLSNPEAYTAQLVKN